jgi:ribosomal protein S18 acetylase RimI-like enzyme
MAASPTIRIRRIAPGDGLLLRDLRLRSIADAPNAFGQPIEEARDRPEKAWHRSARQSSHGDNRTWLIAEQDGRAIGLVQGRKRRPRTLLLFSMWVDPSVRRLGVGRSLIDSLEAWGRGWSASETILWVYGANQEAIGFYRDLGFEVIRSGQDAEAGARFGALAMRRVIATG